MDDADPAGPVDDQDSVRVDGGPSRKGSAGRARVDVMPEARSPEVALEAAAPAPTSDEHTGSASGVDAPDDAGVTGPVGREAADHVGTTAPIVDHAGEHELAVGALPPADELPADELPADEPPADELPADELPPDQRPADVLPADASSADEPPIEEPPADAPPTDDQTP